MRLGLAGLLPTACFSEADPPVVESGDGTSAGTTAGEPDTSGSPATDDAPATTATDSGDATGAPIDSSGGGQTCEWSLTWPATADKDIVFVMIDLAGISGQASILNFGMFNGYLEDLATADGTHIAAVTACEPGGTGCAVVGDGYEFLFIPPPTDPIGVADTALPSEDFFRDAAPDHWVVLSELDTGWDAMALSGSNARLRDAHLHTRIAPGTNNCAAFPGLADLGALPGNTNACADGNFMMQEVIGGPVLVEQPACVIVPSGGGLVSGADDLLLEIGDGTRQMLPPGPVVSCSEDPHAWRLADPVAGPVVLCPALCKQVGGWDTAALQATITFQCP
jgi:hypothetical protein